MGKKLNPHQLLRSYHHREDYPRIARRARSWVGANKDATEAEFLEWVRETYGREARWELRQKAAPLALFGEVGTHIPENAVQQMETVLRLPVAKRGALMADAHLGYAMPIGGVALLEGAVSPSFVGYDISCMVQLTLLDLPVSEFTSHREHFAGALQRVTSFGLGAGFRPGEREHKVMESPLWDEVPILRSLKQLAEKQLGSSGGGNHFADLVVVEFLEEDGKFSEGEEVVGLLTHSGSRGTGHKVATHYVREAEKETRNRARDIPKGYEWLPAGSDLGQEYLAAMRLMGQYARANHDLIHDHFIQRTGTRALQRVWNRHNYAWVDDTSGEVLHRKGATPAEAEQPGIIPGTSGSASYLVRGLGNPDSLHSSAHGAGRFFSRREARHRHNQKAFQHHMAEMDVLHFGVSPDETVLAYKDIEMVMELQAGVVIEPVARMRPKVVVMGGRADDGD